MTDCFFFGCWNDSGHYLFAPGGQLVRYAEGESIVYYASGTHIDGALAPRKLAAYWVRDGRDLCWAGQGKVPGGHVEITYHSAEYPQGQFLLHRLDNGFSAIQWWDRCQGDTRGACNSTILLEGVRTSDEVLAALHEHFPHVVENLARGGPAEKFRKRAYGNWRSNRRSSWWRWCREQ